MSELAVQRRPKSLLPDIAELFTGFPSWTGWRPLFDERLLKLEDEMDDGHYVVRAEIPGIDPDKDVEITVRDGRLTIKAERTEKNSPTGARSSATARSCDRSRCRPVQTKTTSRPPMTTASSPCRWW